MSFKPIVQSRKEWTPPNKENEVFYRTTYYNYSEKKGGKVNKVVIRIGKGIIKKLGWKVGDKLIVLQNEKDHLNMKLIPNEKYGYVLKPAVVPQGEKYMDQKGKSMRATFEGTIDDIESIPRTHRTTVKILQWNVNDNSLEITLPRELKDEEDNRT